MPKTTLDNGPQMKQLASKATSMTRDHAFVHGTTMSVPGIQVKGDLARPEEHPQATKKHKIPKGGQKKTLLGGPTERKARKAFPKAMMASRKVIFALIKQKKPQARISPRVNAQERTKKERAKKAFILNPDSHPLKHTTKKVTATRGNQMTGPPAIGLTSP